MAEAALQRRTEVLATAERLFAERGFHATSVRDIAQALNIKAGSLYAHIQAKEELLWESVSAAADRFFAAVEPIVESDVVPLEKLRRVIAAHVRVVTDSAPSASVYTTQWRHLTEPRPHDSRRDTVPGAAVDIHALGYGRPAARHLHLGVRGARYGFVAQ